MTGRSLVLVGTPKGAFILESDASRRDWSIRGPLCDGWPVQLTYVYVHVGVTSYCASAGAAGTESTRKRNVTTRVLPAGSRLNWWRHWPSALMN